MKSEKQFVNTLEDNIQKRGAMAVLRCMIFCKHFELMIGSLSPPSTSKFC